MDRVNEEQSSEKLEAQAHIWNHVLSYTNSMSLKCATELGIPDAIHQHGGPMSLTELVDALPGVDKTKADCVYRLMRILVHSGFFVLEKIDSSNYEEGYSLTSTSRLLVGDHPFSMKPLVICGLNPILTEPWRQLGRWLQNTEDHTPFHIANNGMSFWEYKERNPRFSHLLDQVMASDTPLVAGVITRDCRQVFEGLDSLVDVGGGTGTLAKVIAEGFPQIHCTVLDLAPVVAGLEGTRNLKYVEGDMFEFIPPSDAVLCKWILHDWSDEKCVQILKKCKEAVTRDEKKGKVIIIDMVIDDQKCDHKSVETKLFFDMLMMTIVGGRERNEKEWAKLFSDAGFSDYRISSLLGLRSIIEVYP
ncbi:trans-resveratrol di-O-methyltransferase-like [Sesamum indicum]|uniref:Trans-resveratrol di-O-methyltransferase-like n=1 Tax=Sesamum indicum TaxID=4182 RepID=A0A6I9U281_SESIN|nr:trans-resveratrol di-O-methyltransferase-like [Sesamum indicum]